MDIISYALLKSEIEKIRSIVSNIPNPIVYRGSIQTENDLPEQPDVGDMYNIEQKSYYGEPGNNVVWNGKEWDSLGSIIDLDLYYTKTQLDSKYASKSNRVVMTSSDTNVKLEPNQFYIFPKMTQLTITLGLEHQSIYNEFHFMFESDSSTTLDLPPNIKTDIAIEPNRIYEVSIVENNLLWNSWAVN